MNNHSLNAPRLPMAMDPVPGPAPSPALPLFVLLALAATLTAGTLLGAVNLFKLHVLFAGVTADVRRFHAAFQLLGLMACFITGVATHVAPKFWAVPPPSRRYLGSIWVLLASALLARGLATLSSPGTVPLVLVSGLAAVAAGALFAAWIVRARLSSPRPALPIDAFLVAGALWWPVGAACWLAGELPAVDEPLLAWGVAAGQEILLFGFVLHWFLGMAPRVSPFFAALMKPKARSGLVLFALLTGGVALRALGYGLAGPSGLAGAGQLAIALALLGYVSTARVLRAIRPSTVPAAVDASMLLSVGWLGAGAAVFATDAACSLTGLGPVHSLLLDGARHSITIGFALGMLMALSSRMVPAFAGRPLPVPGSMVAALVLLHLGALGRWAPALGIAGGPSLLAVSGGSGFVALAGLLLWAANLAHCVWPRHLFLPSSALRRPQPGAPDSGHCCNSCSH